MKKILYLVLLVTGLISGCARNHFNVPTENFADKVKVLGVAPIIVDAGSDIQYPQKEQLVQLVTELNRKYETLFARKLKATGNFYAVTMLDGEPQRLFESLLYRREKRDDANIQYNKYFWKTDELRDYIRKNNLDAVMVIVVSGLTRTDKIYSSNLLSSLNTNYNFLTMTAQILDQNGTILWEYPNFRGHVLDYPPLINLQYPDFSEAEANLSHSAEVKFKNLDGIRRALEHKRTDLLFRETQEPEIYGLHFDEMISLIKYDNDKAKGSVVESEKLQTRTGEPKKGVEQPAAVLQPEVKPIAVPAPDAPKAQPPVVTAPAPIAAPTAPGGADDIVPAAGSTR